MRVRVYRNLASQYRDRRAWSILALEGPKKGRVIGVVDGAVLRDAVYRPYLRALAATERDLAVRGLGATAVSQRRSGVFALRRWASRLASLALAAAHRQLMRA